MKDAIINRLKAAGYCDSSVNSARELPQNEGFLKSLHDLAEEPSENAVTQELFKVAQQ